MRLLPWYTWSVMYSLLSAKSDISTMWRESRTKISVASGGLIAMRYCGFSCMLYKSLTGPAFCQREEERCNMQLLSLNSKAAPFFPVPNRST